MNRLDPARPLFARRDFLGRMLWLLGGAAFLGRARHVEAAPQGIEPYLGEIMLFAGNFPPRNWAMCNGQLLPINQNQGLFSLLGTTYGGNGQTTFALPDLRGRVPIHAGQGPGLSLHDLGERGGESAHTLSIGEMPSHTHVARGSSAAGTSANPAGAYPARSAAQYPQWGAVADSTMAPGAIGNAGGSQAHLNTQPYLVLNYVIALQGVYPPQ